jgi:hypothetical protein
MKKLKSEKNYKDKVMLMWLHLFTIKEEVFIRWEK